MTKMWESYEQVAQYLLDQVGEHLGLERVEGKQSISGASGATWEIDAKGVQQEPAGGVVVIEVKRYTKSKIEQGIVAELAYKIQDAGGQGGILVSPLGFQEGASIVAAAEGVIEVILDPDSTATDYFLKFLNRTFVGVSDTVLVRDSAVVTKIDRETGRIIDSVSLGG